MTTEETQKQGPKWTIDHNCDSYQDALNRVSSLMSKWTDNKQDNMQTKIRRKSDGKFLVKYRKDPAFSKKETKSGNNNRKNKRNSGNGKFDAQASV